MQPNKKNNCKIIFVSDINNMKAHLEEATTFTISAQCDGKNS